MKRFVPVVCALGLAACAPETASVPPSLSSTAANRSGDRAATADPAPVRSGVTLREGTELRVRTTSPIDSAGMRAGDAFTATLAQDLRAGGRLLAPRGTRVDGRVVDAHKGGRIRGRAALALELTRLHAPGSYPVPLHTTSVRRDAPGSAQRDAVTTGIGAGIGAALGAIAGGGKGAAIGAALGAGAGTGYVLATRGRQVRIPAETLLSFRLSAPVTLD